MAIASPREFSQDFCRFLPVYVKTPLFIQPLSAAPFGRNCAESCSALRCWWATITFLCKWKIKSCLNWGFCSQMTTWISSWLLSHEQQQMQSYLKYGFGNSALPNPGLMSTQVFFSCRTWINTASSWGFFFFNFMPKHTALWASKDHVYF